MGVYVFEYEPAQMAAPLTGACVWVSCNSRGWMEVRLSGSQGRVDRLIKTAERDTTASVCGNNQNRHTVLVRVIAAGKHPSICPVCELPSQAFHHPLFTSKKVGGL